MTDFVEDMKGELPDLLQLLLNMNDVMKAQLIRYLKQENGYTKDDAAGFLSTIEPQSMYRWKKGVARMRLYWISTADDLSFLIFKESRSRIFLLRILIATPDLFERDPDTVLTESKKKQWLDMIRSFDNLKFE